ncbi:MAG: septum formation initiator family protein [Bacilli bacterium]|nr:septum formation initiator family protein [Bacilli bacterium]MBQ8901782.1 septum formation initiator family protein [Bacilli bacterium]
MRARTSKKEKKRLFLITIAIITLLALLIGSVYSDWKQILKNRRTEVELTQKYEELLENELKLSAEITKLQDDEYLARYAKEKYMLSAEGDTIIKID